MKKWLFRLIILAVLGVGGWRTYNYFNTLPQRQMQVATTKVRQGDVVVRTFSRGELRAVRSVTLSAPNLFGTVQVTQVAALGALAREKDLVVEFDDSELLSRIEEKQLELDQIDEQIKKARADLAIRNNQDQVELLRTRYSVRRAELEVKRNELISEIDAKKNLLTLEESKRRLTQLESDIKSRLEQAEAELATLNERRNKSVLELAREKTRLMQVKVLSPITGLVAVRQNRASGFFVPGMQVPDIREGDQVQPGMPVADVLDLSELEVMSRIGEMDRANLREGQDVIISLDAVADTRLNGKIKSMSGTASASVFANDPSKKFDVLFSIDMRQLLNALGASPEQIGRIMATAEANRKKPVAASSMTLGGAAMAAMMAAGGPGGPGGPSGPGGPQMPFTAGPGGPGGMPGAGQGAAEGGRGTKGGGGRRGEGGPAGAGNPFAALGNLTDDQRTKLRETIAKMTAGKTVADMKDAEKADLQKKITAELVKAGIKLPDGFNPLMMAGRGGQGGPGGRGRGEGFTGFGGGGGLQFTQADLDKAKLPPPPEEDSQLDVLLRPGMLADVEIIVEKIPNAIHVPSQAVFERDNKFFVYQRTEKGWQELPIVIARRTESTVVVGSGIKPGDTVAMADPFAKPGDKKKGESKGGGAMGAIPAGGAK
ncbi:MAG: efflux RND transporter periplasmic adaptor subunit [Candidatus Solibacter usitatus]|nr:efflux RND transporter periplasmic adaptor subunit [Candidatus Solibacter usitatus]